MTHEAPCPYCGIVIELPVESYDTTEKCPKCNNVVAIQYDYTIAEDEVEFAEYTFAKLADDDLPAIP